MIDFEWILTAAHCVTVVDEGKVRFCDKLRARVPIDLKWDREHLNERFNTKNHHEIFEDIVIPVVENVTVFVYKKYFDFPTTHWGADIALIRIPKTCRPQRLPFRLRSEIDIKSVTVVGFPVVPVNFKSNFWQFFFRLRKIDSTIFRIYRSL